MGVTEMPVDVRRAAGLGAPGAMALWLAVEVWRLRAVEVLPSVCTDLDVVVEPPAGEPWATVRPVELVTVGDSLMAGVGATAVAESLPVQLALRVAERYARPARVTSTGCSGARVADVRSQQLPAVLRRRPRPDVVVCAAGANDTTHLTPPGAFRGELRELVRELRVRTGARVVVSGIPEFRSLERLPWPLREAACRYGERLHQIQREVAADEEGVIFSDAKQRAGARFRADPGMLSEDRFHPSAAGYACLADAVGPEVLAAAAAVGGAGRVDADRR
jgi:lysophospholipase L1-like esterase